MATETKSPNKTKASKTESNGKAPRKETKPKTHKAPKTPNEDLWSNLEVGGEKIRKSWITTLKLLYQQTGGQKFWAKASGGNPVKLAEFRLYSKDNGGIETDHSFKAMIEMGLVRIVKDDSEKRSNFITLDRNGLDLVKKSK